MEEALIQSEKSKKVLLDNIQTQVWYLTNEYIYDAMTEYRTYRKIFSENEAIAEIKKCSGSQFDPGVVKVFVKEVLNK